METLFFVSHTHWDREWYEPFQIFRTRLIRCIDKLLHILETESEYKHFMLDGQTIVLEDYLGVRADREQTLRGYIVSGRLAIGPWYVLPDEFLVSGESIIRNLQRGTRIAGEFSQLRTRDNSHRRSIGAPDDDARGAMRIGYLPDPFGHTSQMPQILRGFGLSTAAFRRGLADEATELWWEAPDGTRVLACYLRDGYDNAAWMERSEGAFVDRIDELRASLAPHANTSNILLMNGTDHMEPWDDLPALLRGARTKIADAEIIHASLQMYVDAVEREIARRKLELEVVRGELRNPKRHHLLPGVASTRMWIKQRNALSQTLLEKWAEPFAAVAALLAKDEQASNLNVTLQESTSKIQLLALAWKYLLENHPHDSICGCGIDQTHVEMKTRFDWSQQIAEQLIRASLSEIASSIDTCNDERMPSIIVFNPAAGPRTDVVEAAIELPGNLDDFHLMEDNGVLVPYQILNRRVEEYYHATGGSELLRSLLAKGERGQMQGKAIQDLFVSADESPIRIDLTLADQGGANTRILGEDLQRIQQLIEQNGNSLFDVRVHSPTKVDLEFIARDVPGIGFKTFFVTSGADIHAQEAEQESFVLENEFFRVEPNHADGTFTITDKSSGAIYRGANHFVDGGDRGDLYNFNAPEYDKLIDLPSGTPKIEIETGLARRSLKCAMTYWLPAKISDDRSARMGELVEEHISTIVSLYPGVRRVDFRTRIDNRARDHRLRVEFTAPIVTAYANADQAFDVVRRSLDMPKDTADWIEQPRPEAPMQSFASISDNQVGMTLATRGLPEYQAYPHRARSGESNSSAGTALALTLLRCIGWLSRDDLSMRSGHAGPALETPGAQEIGEHTFEYALIPHQGDWHNAFTQAQAFATPLRAVASGPHPGTLPPSASLVNAAPHEFVLSAIKPAEDGNAIIVRGYNIGEETIEVTLDLWRDFARSTRVALDEQEIAELMLRGGRQVKLFVRAKEIVTVRFE